MVPCYRLVGQVGPGLLHQVTLVVSGRWLYGDDSPHLGHARLQAVTVVRPSRVTEQAKLVKTVKV